MPSIRSVASFRFISMISLHQFSHVFSAWRPLVVTSLSCVTLMGCGGGGGGADVPASADAQLVVPEAVASPVVPPSPPSDNANALQVAAMAAYGTQINSASANAGLVLESFNDYPALSKWVFIPGGEFPGASGGLTLGASAVTVGNHHADLSANLSCFAASVILTPSSQCGKYVGAHRNLATTVPVDAADTARVQLRIKAAQTLLTPGFRLVDASGQTLQYSMNSNTLEGAAGDEWATISIPVKSPSSWWGGANNGKLQAGVKALSFLVSQPSVVGPVGSLLVDEIRLINSNVVDLALTGQEPVISRGVVPSTDGRLSVNARYYKVNDTSARLAAEAGFKVMRVDLFWETVEQNGRFNFALFDTVLNTLSRHGMKALFILNYGHPDHGGTPVTAQQRVFFLEYVKQATRFAAGRNVVGFEVWNEPDNAAYWKNGDPVTYAELLTAARAMVKSIDPTRVVMNGGPSWFDLPYVLKLAKTGALNELDAFAIHGYRGKMTAPETFAADISRLKAVLGSNDVNVPVWLTEWGVSSAGLAATTYGHGSDARARDWQARMVLRTLLTQMAMNLPYINLYELSDSGTDPNHEEHNFGLLTQGLVAKPSYNALKLLHTLTKGKSYQGLLSGVPATLHGMKWSGGGSSVYTVWADSAAISGRLTVPATAQVLSWNGATVPTVAGPSDTKSLTITSDGGPVHVVF